MRIRLRCMWYHIFIKKIGTRRGARGKGLETVVISFAVIAINKNLKLLLCGVVFHFAELINSPPKIFPKNFFISSNYSEPKLISIV